MTSLTLILSGLGDEMNSDVNYAVIEQQLTALIGNEKDALANCANLVGLLFAEMPNINWLGIYVLRDHELVLGPFQGLPACVRISLGQGVCGAAAAQLQTLRVANVHEFSGHIACDPATRSELVVPLIAAGKLIGVLDIDSPDNDRFSEEDQRGVESLCAQFVTFLLTHDAELKNFI
ncbi:MAG: L-methionine (R)-S-oxide reductase [Woeseiaceae bacterium]|jgi:L-methionine (R)-S-oxide reductase